MSFALALGPDELDPDTADLVGAGPAPHVAYSAAARGPDPGAAPASTLTRASAPLPLAALLPTLPPRISFSRVPVPRNPHVTLYRRDLFDARFQLLLDQDQDQDQDQDHDQDQDQGPPDAPAPSVAPVLSAQSDLIPGQYEGGLKTWECALDLVSVLDQQDGLPRSASDAPVRIVELGCGSALPSAHLLSRALSAPSTTAAGATEFHLLDYNREVLELVTLPNLVLAWYFSGAGGAAQRARFPVEPAPGAGKASIPHHASAHADSTSGPSSSNRDAAAAEAGELELSPELVSAFTTDLAQAGVALFFYAGDWATFPRLPADLVLTSETIYAPAAQASLLDCLRRLRSDEGTGTGTILVAAKVIYFGVGGSVAAFEEQVAQRGGRCTPLLHVTDGVGRVVLSVTWPR